MADNSHSHPWAVKNGDQILIFDVNTLYMRGYSFMLFLSKKSIRVSNGLDPDQDRRRSLHYRPRICPANSRFMCVSNALYVR